MGRMPFGQCESVKVRKCEGAKVRLFSCVAVLVYRWLGAATLQSYEFGHYGRWGQRPSRFLRTTEFG
jgi:hypothetical protein